jgi:hypothetical protein
MRIAKLPVVARHLKIGIGTLAVVLIVIGVWVAILQHARPSAGASMREIDGMLAMGPHLSAGQVDPNEVMAWGLVHASLVQQGCGGNGFSVREMKSTLGTLNANNITAQARELAEQYWQEFGAQMMANIGCGS